MDRIREIYWDYRWWIKYIHLSAAFKILCLLTGNQSRLPGPKLFFLFCFNMGLEKKRPVDPQNPENVTLCSLDPVVSHILTVMAARCIYRHFTTDLEEIISIINWMIFCNTYTVYAISFSHNDFFIREEVTPRSSYALHVFCQTINP